MIRIDARVLLVSAAIFVITSGVCVAQDTTTVILGGTGQAPHIQTVIDGVSDALSSSGVKVKVNSGDSKSRTAILDEMKTSGNSVLLYLTVNTVKGQRGKLLAESFVDGKKIWEEEVRGSLMAVSAEGEVRGMMKNLNEKLKRRVGGPGLPK
ncbi:MAG TPA: hypothetical protein VMI32_05600 [Candidatus Solibacter sp.]|nr:hypothetical protein [Candidatus Solibacter sp.]